jgi:hypothetical protein
VGGRSRTTWWLWAGVLSVGCNTLAGIDDDYVAAPDRSLAGSAGSGVGAEGGFHGIGGEGGGEGGAAGEQGAGGASGTDGAGGSGGTDTPDAAGGLNGLGGSGGTEITGGAGGAAPCGPNQKSCENLCVEPNATFGCSLTDCTPCPDPAPNSEVICGDNQCVARCKTGFVPVGGQCVPENSVDAGGGASGNGGSAGASGRGGSSGRGQCVVEQCPSCSVFRGIACCTFFRTCGCSFADLFYCI